MAPSKRPASSMQGGAKKRKTDVVGQKCTAIAKALLEHGTLPASTSAMLSSMATSCLSVPVAERHAYQAEITTMIGEALQAAEVALSGSVTECKSKVDNSAADKEARAAAVVAASAELEGLVAATAAKKAALEEASKALKAAKAGTAEAKKVQSDGDSVLDAAEAKKAKLVSTVSVDLAPLKLKAIGVSKEDKASLKKLASVGKEFSFDASMLEILPKAVKKEPAERGPFDTICVEKFEEQCSAAVAAIDAELEAGAPGKAERAAAVAAAESSEASADGAEKAAAEALSEAKAAEKAGAAALKEAEKASKSWLSDTKDTMDHYDSMTKTLVSFRDGPLAFYGELKDYVPPPPTPEPEEAPEEPEEPETVPEAPVEAATEVAAEAVAEPAA